MAAPPVVFVINTNPDLVELLKARIEAAGFVVMVLHIAKIRSGALDVGAMVAQHNPLVIVYDVVMPYERNWQMLEHLRSKVFAERQLVITTPNEGALRRLLGRNDKVYEILDDKEDVDAIVQAVREAARARPTR
jgi:DNA-binding NarL/FixJ family response regulator